MVVQHHNFSNDRWQIPSILAAVGQGIEVEEQRAWTGFWNEEIVEAAKQAMREMDVLTVLLTGRNTDFSDLIPKMLQSKWLQFDLIVMKPTFGDKTILQYKLSFINHILSLPSAFGEIEIYEDKEDFRSSFQSFLDGQLRLVDLTVEAARNHTSKPSIEGARLTKFTIPVVKPQTLYLKTDVEKRIVLELFPNLKPHK
jgi:hypothetical protein